MRNNQEPTAMVTDPYTGRTYNFMPLFDYLKAQNSDLERLPGHFETAADIVPHLIGNEEPEFIMDMKNTHCLLTEMRDVFRSIQYLHK